MSSYGQAGSPAPKRGVVERMTSRRGRVRRSQRRACPRGCAPQWRAARNTARRRPHPCRFEPGSVGAHRDVICTDTEILSSNVSANPAVTGQYRRLLAGIGRHGGGVERGTDQHRSVPAVTERDRPITSSSPTPRRHHLARANALVSAVYGAEANHSNGPIYHFFPGARPSGPWRLSRPLLDAPDEKGAMAVTAAAVSRALTSRMIAAATTTRRATGRGVPIRARSRRKPMRSPGAPVGPSGPPAHAARPDTSASSVAHHCW